MKRSQIAMLILVGVIVLVVLIVTGLGRIAIGKTLNNSPAESSVEWAPSGDEVSTIMKLSGFKRCAGC
ncbi:MAG: hypothetical protein J7L76_03440 [Spirochaetaceae bacterium]|nr:hypothetical protein [Spirochaetaceae bacterium]RKX83806.1 MAG: hypothetical protein DRP70_14240 [Spirochaetota bacterium]